MSMSLGNNNNNDFSSKIKEVTHRSQDQQQQQQHHHHGIKEGIEKTFDKVKNAVGGNKSEHSHAQQAGATDPVPMGSDPRVDPLHNANPPETAAKYDNVVNQDYLGGMPPQYPSK
ncbi:hypothetical protein IW140_000195 [Coemansia sp. RSA 1813]|nr:hypothetical protein EV178_006503 [Coemansia sp. RSA 1646]KAJ1765400.1 hypothetical protein LPJ74_006362 [Coemansia sp. RSA 1843]KAJ2093299.1 hypothetical protein IW138_000592 [Coemansia sp. RSA 986]KAJ2213012.1 hypothetical protein EV179_004160 [Coemansia sp. RSA 487]KAJ2573553.1 hypothetical protein IW140_000195 [Coemansia sp. RSA 1813]